MACPGQSKHWPFARSTWAHCLPIFEQAGSERDVVLAMLQQSLTSNTGILSAFTQDRLHGWVYVEAKQARYLAPALRGIPGVARQRNRSLVVQLVELSDRPMLLDMSLHSPPLITLPTGSWVRIKDGLYKGDLGLIRDTCMSDRELYSVMLVPRLVLVKTKKRKHGCCPPKALFDKVEIEQIWGDGSVKMRNQWLLFRNQSFFQGLLVAVYHPARLSLETTHATSDELNFFRSCEYWVEAQNLLNPIRAGDRILVMTGSLQGSSGFVLEVNELTLRFLPSGDVGSIHEVRRAEV